MMRILLFGACMALLLACGGRSGHASSRSTSTPTIAATQAEPSATSRAPSPTSKGSTGSTPPPTTAATKPSTNNPLPTPLPPSQQQVQVDPRFNQPCEPGPDTSKLVQGVNCRNLILDGYVREFLVYMPNGLPSGKTVPLVFMLHGSSGDGEKFLDTSGWRQLADAEKFIAVFPTGLEYWVTDRREGDPRWSTKWNDYTLPSNIDVSKRLPGVPASAPWPADDITFIRAMIADVHAGIKLDPKRIYVAGFSNGGQLASRVAVELSDLVAAVGASEGFMVEKHDAPRSTPIYYTIGTVDDRFLDAFSVPEIPLDPNALQQIPGIRAVIGTQTASFGYETTPCKVDTQVKTTYLTFCDKDPSNGTGEFVLAIIGGLTHNYPNPNNNDAGFVAARAMWDFFVAHPMP